MTIVLNPSHRTILEDESGLSPEVIQRRGYQTVETKAALKSLGFSDSQRCVPALLLPVHNVQGHISLYQIRPDLPSIRHGKPIKYETLSGSRMVLDCHPSARSQLGNPKIPLWITEGIKKGDCLVTRGCCAVALLGVWNWRGTNGEGGKVALPDWESVALNDRAVYLVFDSDVMIKPQVHAALARLSTFLNSRGAHVRFVYLPSAESGGKVGVDDYLVRGHSIDDLLELAAPTLRELPRADHDEQTTGPYQATDTGLVYQKPTPDGAPVPIPLTNFTATITADISEDDGVEKCRRFEVEATLHQRRTRFVISAAQFSSMSWPTEQLGAQAIVFPGFGTRDHVRAAIQLLSSTTMEQRQVYAHLGWREIEGRGWCYLHAAGAIGPDGPVPDQEVAVSSELRRYQLPDPLYDDALISAIRASLCMLELGPRRIVTPVYATIWAPLFGDPAFTVFLSGKTGVFKTELAALAQQHYGAEMSAHQLPGNWSSTANALQGLAFQAKDALVVVDDFAPTGTHTDMQRLHHQADVLLRGQGNRSGRQRMRPDATLRPTKSSRCLILGTGEDVPKGQSLQARMCVLELSADDIDRTRLTKCQQAARTGIYASVMASFLQWLSPRRDVVRSEWVARVAALRSEAASSSLHLRTIDTMAHLGLALREFLTFAEECGALSVTAKEALWHSCWSDLREAAGCQAAHQVASDPVSRFRDLLIGVLTAGRAHVSGMNGEEPGRTTTWGWRGYEQNSGVMVWREQGDRIGWVDEDAGWLYLEPQASYAAVQRLGQDNGEPLSLTARTLRKRLKEAGWLLNESSRSDHTTIRKQIDGQRRDVLAISLSRLMLDEPDQPDQAILSNANGPVSSSLRSGSNPQADHDLDQNSHNDFKCLNGYGPVGPVSTENRPLGSGAPIKSEHLDLFQGPVLTAQSDRTTPVQPDRVLVPEVNLDED